MLTIKLTIIVSKFPPHTTERTAKELKRAVYFETTKSLSPQLTGSFSRIAIFLIPSPHTLVNLKIIVIVGRI